MKEFLLYLKNNLQLIQVHDGKGSYEYYSCGHPHDPRDPDWQPFQHMQEFCRKNRCDFEVAKSMIEDQRKILDEMASFYDLHFKED